MKKTQLSLPGLLLLEPPIYRDERGFFLESYRKPLYENLGIHVDFVQDNLVFSKKNILRGMHFQMGQGQHKLVSVIEGEIFDVAVDMREGLPTFGQWEGVLLNSKTLQQFYIPSGFAHGYLVLSETAIVQYKVSPIYDPILEKGFAWNDPELGILWPITEPLLSPRDAAAPSFAACFQSMRQ